LVFLYFKLLAGDFYNCEHNFSILYDPVWIGY
jgi:hypothetical protein